MANELLDFVMSLVRDPEVAARYAADPAATLSAANLSGVTSVDVNNLLPMVSESLSMGSPLASAGDDMSGNVWTSGAATAAFDSFTPHTTAAGSPTTPAIDGNRWSEGIAAHSATGVDQIVEPVASESDYEVSALDAAHRMDHDSPADGTGGDLSGWENWGHPGMDDPRHGGHPGFDIVD